MEKLPELIHQSWHPYLQPLFDDPKMFMIKDKILPNCKYYPEASKIFNAFRMPLDRIKVVIIGQDPYPKGEAIGYSFAVNKTMRIPPSLSIIKNEISNSRVEIQSNIFETDEWKELKHWRQQGVFLLNSALTVEALAAGSHIQIWEWFTRVVVGIISSEAKPIWLLWGAKAKGYKSYILSPQIWNGALIRSPFANYILEADHPAAETYPGSKYKFTGCNHFKLCNQILKLKGQSIINW